MSLLPYLEDYSRPSRILDQQFGLALEIEDLEAPVCSPVEPALATMHLQPSASMGYIRPWRTAVSENDFGSTLVVDKDKFQASLDVKQFVPDNITVTLTGNNTITVEGKHDERRDGHSLVARQFMRKYVIPKDCDHKKIESKLSSDGVLTITAPRFKSDGTEEHIKIPIIATRKPANFDEKEEARKEEVKKEAKKAEKKARKSQDQISPNPNIIVGHFPISPS